MWPDFRYAARTLVSSRLFTAVAVTCLALSIATNTTMFSVFDAIFWRPLPFAKPDQLVSISGRHPETGRRVALSLDDVRGLRAQRVQCIVQPGVHRTSSDCSALESPFWIAGCGERKFSGLPG